MTDSEQIKGAETEPVGATGNSEGFEAAREALLARHRKEKRDLMSQITAKKKQATKGEKKKKKDILKQCDAMEQELQARHARELSEFEADPSTNAGGSSEKSAATGADAESEDELSPEKLLAELELEESSKPSAASAASAVSANSSASVEPRPRRNRQKERQNRKQAKLQQIRAEAEKEAAAQPNLRQQELDNIEELCKIQHLVQHDILPDGHCLYASIADQLSHRHHITETVESLRGKAAGYIRSHPDDFTPFLFDEETLSVTPVEEYCDRIENTPIWGGDCEILALARVFDCPVTVIMSARAPLKFNESGENPELKLAYYKHAYGLGEHYNSLRDE